MNYNYYELHLRRGRGTQKALAGHLHATLGPALIGVFAPVLGLASTSALVLTDGSAPYEAIMRAPGVVSAERHRVTPTLRPADGARPAAMGVYVHHWFTIDASAFDEFVRLSGEAWPEFEAGFESKIFGLFAAEPTKDDLMEGARRLLLMTGYRDLHEWERSRAPGKTAASAFTRRQDLTRVGLARAVTLIPIG